MKKLIAVLAIFMFATCAAAQQTAELSKSATFTIPPLYYADENINFTTATTADLTCKLVSSASSTPVALTNTGFEIVNDTYRFFLPGNLLNTVGDYKFYYNASECILGWEDIRVISSDAFYEYKNGISGKIVSVTNIIIAAGNIIPSTGILLHDIPTLTHAGATPYNYMFSGISKYATAPNIAITIQDTVSGFNQYATASAFTHVTAQNYQDTVDGDNVWEHVWFYPINTNTLPFGNYKVFVHSTSMDRPVAAMGSLIHSTTVPVDLTGIVTETYMVANLIHPTSQSFEDLLSGDNIQWTAYYAESPNTRTVAEYTSASNRSYATADVYGTQAVYPQRFASTAGSTSWATKWFVYDYDDSWMSLKSARSIIYEVTMNIPAFAAIEGVTITVAGG